MLNITGAVQYRKEMRLSRQEVSLDRDLEGVCSSPAHWAGPAASAVRRSSCPSLEGYCTWVFVNLEISNYPRGGRG